MPLWTSQVLIQSSLLGGTGTNSWHARTTEGPAEPESAESQLQELTGIIEDFYGGILPLIGGGTVFDFEALWVSVDEDEAVGIDVDGWSVTASGSDAIMAPQDCLVAGWRTSSPTRGGRGRTFLGPLKTAGVLDANGTPTESSRGTVTTAGEALIEASDSFANGALGVYSRAGVANPANPGIFRDFTGVRCRNVFGTLRSRRD